MLWRDCRATAVAFVDVCVDARVDAQGAWPRIDR